jgi:rare lipoprotein A
MRRDGTAKLHTFALVAALTALLAGCAPYRAEVPSGPDSSRTVIDAPRSPRGNPPFYEVFGRRYHVLQSSDDYHERGVASWYGRDFHGKPTSGGEPYDMHAMTAAHKTLPIPTWVEVTNLSNGKRVTVRVNDRGPFVDNRLIDLSYQAALELDMIRTGTTRVQVRALGAPNLPPVTTTADAEPRRAAFSILSEAEADAPRPGDRPLQQLYVQVGAFAERDNAAKLVARLKLGGIDNCFVVSSGAGRDALHRVRVGPLTDAQEFDRVNVDLRALGLNDSRLVVEN